MMIHKHRIPLFVSAFALCVMAGCDNNNAKTNTDDATQPEMTVDDGVDWNTPLYELGNDGDTINKYAYNAEGKLIADYEYYDGNPIYTHTYEYDNNGNLISTTSLYEGNPIGAETRKYDEQNRLVSCEYDEESDSGVFEYTYEGNKCVEHAEESLSECVYQDVTETYYDENGNDTLVVRSSALVRDQTDGEYNYNVELAIYKTRKTYVTINGTQKLKLSVCNEEKKDGSVVLKDQEEYEYDDLGRVVSYSHHNKFCEELPASVDMYTYKYYDNCREDQNGNKTYYNARKH